jgi:hypothetical protein
MSWIRDTKGSTDSTFEKVAHKAVKKSEKVDNQSTIGTE